MLDRYRLIECLGAGGFGVVWSARDELLHREVAVKRVALSPQGDSERATREALASARLAHPAIVALYEACAVDDAFYLISELIHGQTLAQLIAAGSLSDEDVLRSASPSQVRWSTRTPGASSIAMSSRRTCSSLPERATGALRRTPSPS